MTNKKIKKSQLRFTISLVLLTLGTGLLQYYFTSSGSIQISQLILIFFSLYSINSLNNNRKSISLNIRLSFSFFCIYAVLVNCIQYSINLEDPLIKSNLYILYNAIVFFSVVTFYIGSTRQHTIRSCVIWTSLTMLFIAVVQYFFGLGRYDFAPRYNGFFNDPNQMAFWGLCSFGMVSILAKDLKTTLPAFIATIMICLITMSRSALLGIAPMIVGVLLKMGRSIYKSKYFLIILIILALLICFTILINPQFELTENNIYFINRITSTNVESQMEARGYRLLYDYPEQMIFGAGQGDMMRFNHDGEIHSTWHGILFYYGIIGLAFFLGFLFNLYKRLPLSDILIGLGPLLYSFTTYGARTPIFYIFLACIYISVHRNRVSAHQSIVDSHKFRNLLE